MKTILQDLPTYIDYNWLMYALRRYVSPRVKIHAFLKSGEIIRIKKGIYVPGKKYGRSISSGVLANLICGPSYVSYEYALGWYGIIPERAYGISSACIKKNKEFRTPVGTFWYRKIPSNVFSLGVDLVADGEASFLIATPEKALADSIAHVKDIASPNDLEHYLFEEQRMDSEACRRLNVPLLNTIADAYGRKQVNILSDYLSKKVKK